MMCLATKLKERLLFTDYGNKYCCHIIYDYASMKIKFEI